MKNLPCAQLTWPSVQFMTMFSFPQCTRRRPTGNLKGQKVQTSMSGKIREKKTKDKWETWEEEERATCECGHKTKKKIHRTDKDGV